MAERKGSIDPGCVSDTYPPERETAFLTITVPSGRQKDMCRLLKPYLKNMECLADHLDIQDNVTSSVPLKTPFPVPEFGVVDEELSSPALSVMMFVSEFGDACAEKVRGNFKKFPWRHHHTIQLQKAGSSNVLGQHEFYFLSRELPLFSVCDSPHTLSYVRFNVFVRRFNAMVEFYRLITGTEMESRKPGFSIFSLSKVHHIDNANPPQAMCELALKHSPQVSPYPLTDAYLTFPVHNLQDLLAILPSDAHRLSAHHFLVHDPDGNPVVLYEIPKLEQYKLNQNQVPQPVQINTFIDKDSVHSDSIDSGRFSDYDTYTNELDQCMARLAVVCNLDTHAKPLPVKTLQPTAHRKGTCSIVTKTSSDSSSVLDSSSSGLGSQSTHSFQGSNPPSLPLIAENSRPHHSDKLAHKSKHSLDDHHTPNMNQAITIDLTQIDRLSRNTKPSALYSDNLNLNPNPTNVNTFRIHENDSLQAPHSHHQVSHQVPHPFHQVPHQPLQVPHPLQQVPRSLHQATHLLNQVPHHLQQEPHPLHQVPHQLQEVPHPIHQVPHPLHQNKRPEQVQTIVTHKDTYV
ncbi:uncharacterized protein LOC131951885 [Physella acuta]|uniref:uncharacterized protein LOC131951885 n=1 Tax=Physella acuta TaxID=109671 RepID=UPI0027DDB0A6|nr:uncharacterized protein LOC131951885 [Physella acuta]